MASFYERMQATAEKLLADKGADVTINRQNSTFDPVTSVSTPTSVDTQTLKAVLLAGGGTYDTSLPEGQIIGRVKSAILSTVGSTYVPEPLDELVSGNEVWTVFGVSSVNPTNALAVIFKVGIMYKNPTP